MWDKKDPKVKDIFKNTNTFLERIINLIPRQQQQQKYIIIHWSINVLFESTLHNCLELKFVKVSYKNESLVSTHNLSNLKHSPCLEYW